MEFKEYMKIKNRMTNCCEPKRCVECPLNVNNNGYKCICRVFEIRYSEKAEAIVQKWADEHPVVTNKDKYREVYREVFGKRLTRSNRSFTTCPPHIAYPEQCKQIGGCDKCMKWWEEEYKKPDARKETK